MDNINNSRRHFLKSSAALSGSLVLGFTLADASKMAVAQGKTTAQPNAWIKIDSDNQITILCARSEMGQGVFTGMPMLVAEELNVDFSKIRVEMAPVSKAYINRMLGLANLQITGGSSSTRDGWETLRTAGATARMMLVSAAAQTWGVPESSCKAQNGVITHTSGKRLTYGEVAAKAAQLEPPKQVALKSPEQFNIVGKPIKRLDTPAKVTGKAQFGIDVKLPGMLHAAIAMCPVLGGKVKSFNADKAKAMPGVRHVVQVSDGVAVVADSFWQAKKAREVLEVTWDEGKNAAMSTDSVHKKLIDAASKNGVSVRKAGTSEASAGAVKTLEAVYDMPFLAHAAMEPANFTADVRADGADVYGGTQSQTVVQNVVAGICGLKPEQVKVHTTFLGGGFGRRFEMDYVRQATEISKAVKAPVKLVWTREDDMQHDFYRPIARNTLRADLGKDGKMLAWRYKIVSPSILLRSGPARVKNGIDPLMVEGAINWPYEVSNLDVDLVITDVGVDVGPWRSVSNSLNVFCAEGFIDEAALAAKADPIAFRMAHLDKEPRLKEALKVAAKKAGWGRAKAGRYLGVAAMEGYETRMAMVSEISLTPEREVRVEKITVAVDCGHMVNPSIVRAQIESSIIYGLTATYNGEITMKDGRVEQSNFHDYPAMRINEVPQIEIHLIPSTAEPGGIGEPATALVAPSVVNAVFAATGKRLRALPLSKANLKA
jgi:isoquinoline 1-oxidoreductase beta subunit